MVNKAKTRPSKPRKTNDGAVSVDSHVTNLLDAMRLLATSDPYTMAAIIECIRREWHDCTPPDNVTAIRLIREHAAELKEDAIESNREVVIRTSVTA